MRALPQIESIRVVLEQQKPGLWKFMTTLIRPDLGGGEAMQIDITRCFNRGPSVSTVQAETEALQAAQAAIAKRLEFLAGAG